MGRVRHRRYYIQTLSASGRSVPSTGGDLIVASKEQTGDLDWELIHRSSQRYVIRQEPYDLEMSGPEGTLQRSGDSRPLRRQVACLPGCR